MGHDTLSKRVKGVLSLSQMKSKVSDWSDNDSEEYGNQEGYWSSVDFNDFKFIDTNHVYSIKEASDLSDKHANDYNGCILYVYQGKDSKKPALTDKESFNYLEKRMTLEKRVMETLGVEQAESWGLASQALFEQSKVFTCNECKSKINLSRSKRDLNISFSNNTGRGFRELSFADKPIGYYLKRSDKDISWKMINTLIRKDTLKLIPSEIKVVCPVCKSNQEDVKKILPKMASIFTKVNKILDTIEELDNKIISLLKSRLGEATSDKRKISDLSKEELACVDTEFYVDVHC